MNILLTCAGRRNYLVDYFKEALDGKGKVYTVNSTLDATSMIVSDGALVAPPLYDEDKYISYLIRVCHTYEIKLLVSLFDLELPILARHKANFKELGVTIAVSDPEVVATCNDKLKTTAFLKSLRLKSLFTTTDVNEAISHIKNGNLRFPLFVKPRWGMGSIAVQEADNMEELKVFFKKTKKSINNTYLKYYDSLDLEASVIIQEKAQGQEYGLDVINDLNGSYVTTFVKKKLAMRSGETDGAITEEVPELKALGKKIGINLRHIGNLDIDVFLHRGQPVILEMNARFGGGYPFSHLAGANIPRAYISWVKGESVAFDYLRVNSGIKGLKALNILNFNKVKII